MVTYLSLVVNKTPKDKYVTILDIYQDNLNKLMNPIKNKNTHSMTSRRDEDYDNDVNTENLFNDTPQNSDVIADLDDNQFVSNLSKGNAHTDNTGFTTENLHSSDESENDAYTIMERIKDIQDSFQKVLYKWSEEFNDLFLEPLNV